MFRNLGKRRNYWREMIGANIRWEERFAHITGFEKRLSFSSPAIHGDEWEYAAKALELGQSDVNGENIDWLEEVAARYIGVKSAVALNSGTAALHLAVKLAAERLYGSSSGISTPDGLGSGGSLKGRRVFCSDFTSASAAAPILYEGGEPVFIDASMGDWNMDPEVLAIAFDQFPDVKLVVYAHLYGFPGRIDEIKKICQDHGALLIEDASESLGAQYKGKQTGSFGDYGVLSFGSNGIITGGSGGMLLVKDRYSAEKAAKWSQQSREDAIWCQHEELGYSYGMNNITAGIVRGQWKYLDTHIEKKRAIYKRYADRLADLDIQMNPYDGQCCEPNFCCSCMMLGDNSLCEHQRSDKGYAYSSVHGRTCPDEILDALESFWAEGRPVWKPMHMQPMYRNHEFVSVDGCRRSFREFYMKMLAEADEGAYVFIRAACLPCGVGMTVDEQERVIEIVWGCFQ